MKKILISFLFLLSTVAMAENQVILNVGLTPAGSFQATSKKVKGNLVKTGDSFTADTISVSIESFKTGIDLRDEHFWKHLNSSKHSKATLTNLKAQAGKATADLEVNGIKKSVSMTYKIQNNEVVAHMNVNAQDYSLPKAEYLGVGVSNDVKVEVTLGYK